jgi:hypothetical protein
MGQMSATRINTGARPSPIKVCKTFSEHGWRHRNGGGQEKPFSGTSPALVHLICAQFVPEDVASGDLSDFADFRISNLHVLNTWVRFDPPSRHHR